jgi:hypothetical protein
LSARLGPIPCQNLFPREYFSLHVIAFIPNSDWKIQKTSCDWPSVVVAPPWTQSQNHLKIRICPCRSMKNAIVVRECELEIKILKSRAIRGHVVIVEE